MALKTVFPFPIFAPITSTTTTTAPSTTEVRFSRWNNANAEKFNRRTQQNIEDDLRRLRRFQSALNITNNYTPATSSPSSPPHKSTGTPSFPSLPSIPGKKSKYSKTLINRKTPAHPAFQKAAKRSKLPRGGEAAEESGSVGGETEVKVSDRGGLTYVVPGAPFEFMYSYTEAPKGVRPVGLREPAVAPFGPGTMPRPWTGRKPLPGTKKLLPEFDSFQLPPAGKKGVKSVQKPGPYLPGSGPRYVMTREEVLGEPLTEVEVRELIEGCKKARRQLNMGRDGLTHNMLDNIHAHWKRRRVCKIKCKGVCTVDMDNVCEQLEERTGGKIIYRRGGVLFLFRGRNYNYKTRPRFPLMLWKPVSPVYPRLVKRVPEGLTLEEATEMRRRGRELIPICKLGKNGVYVRLVKHVKEAFEVCDLVRVNCEGLNPSDYRKIGAKLKDLVPCVLISFEYEHILMWRGNDWTSSLVLSETGSEDYQISERDRDEFLGSDTSDLSDPAVSDDEQESEPCSSNISKFETYDEMPTLSEVLTTESDVDVMGCEDTISLKDDVPTEANGVNSNQTNGLGRDSAFGLVNPSDNDITSAVNSLETKSRNVVDFCDMDPTSASVQSAFVPNADGISDLEGVVGSSPRSSAGDGDPQVSVENTESSPSLAASPCTEGVLFLLRQALDSGSAIILDDSSLDADVIYKKSVAFAQVAPPGPAFRQRPRKVAIQKSETLESVEGVVVEADNVVHEPVAEKKSSRKTLKNKKSSRTPKPKDFKEEFLDVVPQGSLKLDELAKLLA